MISHADLDVNVLGHLHGWLMSVDDAFEGRAGVEPRHGVMWIWLWNGIDVGVGFG